MLFCDFQYKIKKLNKELWFDQRHQQNPYHKDFPTCGLYRNKFSLHEINGPDHSTRWEYIPDFVCSVARNLVPEYRIEDLRQSKILAPGWRETIMKLIRSGHIDKRKAEREFRTYFEPERPIETLHKINFDLGIEESDGFY